MGQTISTSIADTSMQDRSVKATEDFYRHANGTWLKDHEIPSDRPADGAFHKLRDEAELNVRQIVQSLNENSDDPDERKLATLFSQFMDEDAVEELGVSPLLEDFRLIQDATNHEELARALGHLQESGVDGMVMVGVDPDMNDPEQYCVLVLQSGLSLPDEAYYRDERYEALRHALVAYLNNAASIISQDERFQSWKEEVGDSFGSDVLEYETTVAKSHWDNVACRDAVKSNNPTTLGEFFATYDGFPWQTWWTATGYPTGEQTPINVRQPSYVQAVATLWSDTPLDVLKKWVYAQVIQARSAYLNRAMVDNNFEFNRLFTGATELRARWKRGVSLLESAMGEALGKLYVQKFFPPQYKAQMLDLVNHLIEAYRRSISSLAWMSDETRERALEKLEQFTPKIGYPDEWRDYGGLELGATLVESVRAASRFYVSFDGSRLGRPVNKNEWSMTPQTVNAYYHPSRNEIAFPAAILSHPFFDPNASDAVNYGAIGAVIGHEIGHGFDDQGSHYDGRGRLNNWWTDEDREAFQARTACLVDQYNQFSPAQLDDDYKVNGELTLGENIGDLGGLGIAWKAYQIVLEERGLSDSSEAVLEGSTEETREDGAGNTPVSSSEDPREGMSGAEQFFYSWARIWAQKARDEYAIQLLAIDPHSPAEFRCNGVLRNLGAFHRTFGTKPGDGMWLDEDQRVEIW